MLASHAIRKQRQTGQSRFAAAFVALFVFLRLRITLVDEAEGRVRSGQEVAKFQL